VAWQPGRERVSELLDTGELDLVVADRGVADRLLADASRHLASAAAAAQIGDLSGAYQLAYDALRKSAAGLLAIQGLRATSRGGHIAIQDAVVAQFGASVRVFRSFSRVRRARNSFEYPDTETGGPTTDDVDDVLSVATQAHRAALTILDRNLLTPWK